jgi:hypothetical protein
MKCTASVCAISISGVDSICDVVASTALGSRVLARKIYMARTYLFLLITRLGPAACSGDVAVFFLAIEPNERICRTVRGTKECGYK